MSYSIMYDRQVIKTPTGYTFAILCGDNNVYETDRRRARDWSCWVLNKTEAELDTFFKSMTGRTYQEHFKCNGKWVDDAGLIRWYKNGVKNAKTVEEFMALYCSIRCYVAIWDGDQRSEKLDRYVHSTDEFLQWISEVEALQKNATTEHIYPATSFGTREALRLPRKMPKLRGRVYVKYKSKYLTDISKNGWSTCPEARKAKIFDSLASAQQVVDATRTQWERKYFTYHDADRLLKDMQRKDHVIAIYRWSTKEYFYCKTRGRIHTAYEIEHARHFTKAEAERYLGKLHPADTSVRLCVEEDAGAA